MAQTRRKAAGWCLFGCAMILVLGCVVSAIILWDATVLRVVTYVGAGLAGAYLALFLDWLLEEADVTGRMFDGYESGPCRPPDPRYDLPDGERPEEPQ